VGSLFHYIFILLLYQSLLQNSLFSPSTRLVALSVESRRNIKIGGSGGMI